MLAGLRRGELLGLRWSDVDFDASIIHAAQQYAPAEAIFKPTKGRRERKVPLGATLAADARAPTPLRASGRACLRRRRNTLDGHGQAASPR